MAMRVASAAWAGVGAARVAVETVSVAPAVAAGVVEAASAAPDVAVAEPTAKPGVDVAAAARRQLAAGRPGAEAAGTEPAPVGAQAARKVLAAVKLPSTPAIILMAWRRVSWPCW